MREKLPPQLSFKENLTTGCLLYSLFAAAYATGATIWLIDRWQKLQHELKAHKDTRPPTSGPAAESEK